VKQVLRVSAGALALVVFLSAQTLQQAEALWKARRYFDANEIFKQLTAREPKNADYRVRWGLLFLDYAQPGEARDLFNEALEIKSDHAGAILGIALVAAEGFQGNAADLARKALSIDPKRWSKPRSCWPGSPSKTTTIRGLSKKRKRH
jgi:tetratricopeptide (TPR) repeat protein